MTMPELDDEYWLMVEEHIALRKLYLNANMSFIVEDMQTGPRWLHLWWRRLCVGCCQGCSIVPQKV